MRLDSVLRGRLWFRRQALGTVLSKSNSSLMSSSSGEPLIAMKYTGSRSSMTSSPLRQDKHLRFSRFAERRLRIRPNLVENDISEVLYTLEVLLPVCMVSRRIKQERTNALDETLIKLTLRQLAKVRNKLVLVHPIELVLFTDRHRHEEG